MPSRLNKLMLRELTEQFGKADTCLFVDFSGLSGRKAADLRHQLRSTCGEAATFSVVRTSLAKRAFAQNEGLSALVDGPLAECLAGPTAIAYGADDPALLARTLADWGRKEQLLRFKGGLFAGRPLSAGAAAELAKIPPRPILMAHVIGAIAAPLTSFLNVGTGLIRKVMGLADALAKKKTEEGSD